MLVFALRIHVHNHMQRQAFQLTPIFTFKSATHCPRVQPLPTSASATPLTGFLMQQQAIQLTQNITVTVAHMAAEQWQQ
jgi:hypothetical protein